eukprot:COSAG02_NODE_469_length_21727_cov_64.506334_3_plen_130_part_00
MAEPDGGHRPARGPPSVSGACAAAGERRLARSGEGWIGPRARVAGLRSFAEGGPLMYQGVVSVARWVGGVARLELPSRRGDPGPGKITQQPAWGAAAWHTHPTLVSTQYCAAASDWRSVHVLGVVTVVI